MRSVLASLGAVVLLSSSVSFACSCIGGLTPCERMNTSAIFVGTVKETAPVSHSLTVGNESIRVGGYSMRFAVEEPLQGVSGTEVQIETGSGGGDCGTPLQPGTRILIFAYKNETDGKLWTGLCSDNRLLNGGPDDAKVLDEYRALAKKETGSIFGNVMGSEPSWKGSSLERRNSKAMKDVVLHAKSDDFTATVKTNADGAFEFAGLPKGKYTVAPDMASGMDYSHEYPKGYQADISNGACKRMGFNIQPSTRIRGRVELREGFDKGGVTVVALPISVEKTDQFSGTWAFTNKDGEFDLWPLPEGDYYVGVNITRSPSPDSPYPPTYYPGVQDKTNAVVVHVATGEIKEVNLKLTWASPFVGKSPDLWH